MNTMINDSHGDHICGEKCSYQEYCNKKTLPPPIRSLRFSVKNNTISVAFEGIAKKYQTLAMEYWIVYKKDQIPLTPCDGVVKKVPSLTGWITVNLTDQVKDGENYGVRIYIKGAHGFQTSPDMSGYTNDGGPTDDPEDYEVTEPNDIEMVLPDNVPQKSLDEIWSIIKRTPLRSTEATYYKFGKFEAGLGKYGSGVLAPNGKIYCMPSTASDIMEIDPKTDELTFWPANNKDVEFKYMAAALAPNGKIYAMPYNAEQILEFNPQSKNVRYIGSFSGSSKYRGCVVGPNGKIYAFPNDAPSILEFDPETDKANFYDIENQGTSQFWECILAPNGHIYGIPALYGEILEFDFHNKEIYQRSTVTNYGSASYGGAALSPDGNIYAIPRNSPSVLAINPNTNIVKSFGSLDTKTKYNGGVLGANGKIYGVSAFAPKLIEINSKDYTINQFGSISINSISGYCGGVMAMNGKIYCIPFGATEIMVIDPGWRYKDPSVCLSPYLNKY